MNIDSIQNGVVLDHIQAGKSMDIYRYLHLDQLDCSVAIIKNVRSGRMGKKDIIKIDSPMEVDLDVLGYIDPNITVNIIRNGVRVERSIWSFRKAGECHPLQKPPLHHRGGAAAGRHIPAERSRHSHLSLRLLRDRKGQEVLIPRDGTARSDCVDIQFFLRQGIRILHCRNVFLQCRIFFAISVAFWRKMAYTAARI